MQNKKYKKFFESNLYPIHSIRDAETFVQNSGVFDFDFGPRGSWEDFAKFIYNNYNVIDRNDYDDELRAYLRSIRENPRNFGL